MQGEKVREKSGNFQKSKKSQGNVRELCCVKLIFSQPEHPNFENFLGACSQTPLNGLGHT